MSLRWLGVSFAFTLALAAQPAGAAQDVACPEGQAIRAIADKTAVCVPVPPPANLDSLNAAIGAETAARKAADEELPDRLDVTILTGSYAFSGATTCLNSSKGFVDPNNADPEKRNFSPLLEPSGPGVLPTVVAASSQSVQGVRTFDGNGRGTISGIVHNINYPPLLYFLDSPAFTPFSNAGTANTSTLRGTFSYEVTPEGMLIITDDPSDGEVTAGNPSILHWNVSARNVPKTSAKLAKDLKTISTTHADMGMEILVVTSPDGATVRTNPRICHRERMLLKLKG